MLVATLIVLFVLVSFGMGFAFGLLLRSTSTPKAIPPPAGQADLAATSRTVQRLAERGLIDEALRAKLFELLREVKLLESQGEERARQQQRAAPATHSDAVPPPWNASPGETVPSQPPTPVTSAASVGAAVDLARPDDEEAPVTAEIIEPLAAPAAARPAPPPEWAESTPRAMPPRPARRALADVLQAFLEEKNIRWGELISGVLIVGCSIALVISLRREIEDLSQRFVYLPALLFMLATAAIHAAGNYTLRRWNLRATSRGVLIIATLLIPINFLAAIIVTQGESRQLPLWHPLSLAAMTVGITAFSAMAYFAGQALMGSGWWRFLIAVMGPSVGQLVINRGTGPSPQPLAAVLLLALPLAGFLAATVWQLHLIAGRRRLGVKLAGETLLLLGVAAFSLATAVGLLLSHADSLRTALAWLSTPLTLPAVVVLATGLALHRRVTARSLTSLRTVGTALALFGGFLMLVTVGLAWPEPELLVAVGLFGFGALTALAWAGRLPALHVAALACGTLAYLTGFQLWQDAFAGHSHRMSQRLVELFLTGRSSLALTVLALVVAGTAGWLAQRGRRAVGVSYLAGSIGIAALSLASAVVVGFLGKPAQEPDLTTPVMLLYGILLLLATYFQPRQVLTWFGSSLLLLTYVHALAWNEVVRQLLESWSLLPQRPMLMALLLHGVMAAVGTAWLAVRRARPQSEQSLLEQRWRQMLTPLTASSLASSLVVLPLAIWVVRQQFVEHAWYMAALSLIWLAAAVVHRSHFGLQVFQLLATTVVVFATSAISQRQDWWSGNLWLPQHLQAQCSVLSVWCLGWSLWRWWLRERQPAWATWIELDKVSVDEVLLGATLLSLLLLCLVGGWPSAASELGLAEGWARDMDATREAIFGAGSWVALLLTFTALLTTLAARFSLAAYSGLFLALAVAMLLLAGQFDETQAVASASRWLFAAYGVVLTGAICFADTLGGVLRRIPGLHANEWPPRLDRPARSWTLGISAIPVLGLTTASLIQAAAGVAPGGPDAASLFSRIGPELSYGVPLGLLAATLVVHALRERNSHFMLGGSAVSLYLVNLAYFLPILQSPTATFGWSVLVGCLQWNALGLAVYTLAWLGMRPWLVRRGQPSSESRDPPLAVQVGATVLAIGAVAALATAAVVVTPADLTPFTSLGSWPTYAALLLSVVAVVWFVWPRLAVTIPVVLGFLLALGGPLAISFEGVPGTWQGYHALMIVWAATAALATAVSLRGGWQASPSVADIASRWPSGLIFLTVLLSLRAVPADPQTPWWSFGVTLGAAFLIGILGVRWRSQRYAYVSALLSGTAVSMAWWGAWPTTGAQGLLELVQLNLISLVLVGVVWLAAELHFQFRHRQAFDRLFRGPAFHRLSAVVVCTLFVVLVLLGFGLTGLLGVPRRNLDLSNLWGVILLASTGVLLIGSLWDRAMKLSWPALYGWGLASLFVLLDQVDQQYGFDNQTVAVLAGLLVAGYVALTGHAWKWGANLAVIGRRMAMPNTVSQLRRTAHWLPVVSLLLAIGIAAVEGLFVLVFRERWMRVSAAFAPLLLSYGVACLAQQQRRSRMQYVALVLASLSAVYAAWADIEPGFRDTYVLERAVRLLMVLAGLALLYGLPLARWAKERGGDWFPIIRRMAVACGAGALVTLAVVLLLELAYFQPGRGVPFGHPYQVVAVAVTLVGLMVAFLSFALSPQRDPLALSEQGRKGYVYAAQVVGALLFAHLYLSDPSLFGAFQPYWPFIVVGIAFAGVGVGELLQRSGLSVLADPLQRTGSFLPLLPALGWWLNGALGIEAGGHYALLLFLVGLLYALVSMLRRSYVSAAAAALAGNAALWAVLADYEPLSLLRHPQFWLIPPAVSALVAAQLNRRRLTEHQLTAVRYLALLVIYVSSTADIFIGGVGDSLWEPMVLALLSVIGVFVGIGLRVRAFLYLGATFVFLSVVSMVWHAYARIHHVGIWWAFGIALGLAILTFFGLFEKKRPEITRWVERMKGWAR